MRVGDWLRVVEGFHAGQVGVLMGADTSSFGRTFLELVVDDGHGVIRCRDTDVVPL